MPSFRNFFEFQNNLIDFEHRTDEEILRIVSQHLEQLNSVIELDLDPNEGRSLDPSLQRILQQIRSDSELGPRQAGQSQPIRNQNISQPSSMLLARTSRQLATSPNSNVTPQQIASTSWQPSNSNIDNDSLAPAEISNNESTTSSTNNQFFSFTQLKLPSSTTAKSEHQHQEVTQKQQQQEQQHHHHQNYQILVSPRQPEDEENETSIKCKQRLNSNNEKDGSRLPVEANNDYLHSYIDLSNIVPSLSKHRHLGIVTDFLTDGSTFTGTQKSKSDSYDVNVKIQHVDVENSFLCGYLCINHLTKDHPSLTTFFEGEIISKKHPFLTRKWDADADADQIHWSRFDGFKSKYIETFNSNDFDYSKLDEDDCIYMRWKELFLVPDHTIKSIEGASYAGFYYICMSKKTGNIRGYYYHVSDNFFFESFQTLDLKFNEQRSSAIYQFR